MKEKLFENVGGNQFKLNTEGMWDTIKGVAQGAKAGYDKNKQNQASGKFVQNAHQIGQKLLQDLTKLKNGAV